MVKEFLSQREVSFKEFDVSRDRAAAQELVDRTGQMGVPVTVVDGQPIVGFDRARLEQALSQKQAGGSPHLGAAIADAGKVMTGGGGARSGAYVGRVRPGSIAEAVGLAPGDVITELNGQPVATASDLEVALSRLNKGSRLSLVFIRGGRTMNAEGAL